MAPNSNGLNERINKRILAANKDNRAAVVADFDRSNLIPQRITSRTPLSDFGREFFLRTGVVKKTDDEAETASEELRELAKGFSELTETERQEYAEHLGGSLLTHMREVDDIVMDYSGVVNRAKLMEFRQFLGFVVANANPMTIEDHLPATS